MTVNTAGNLTGAQLDSALRSIDGARVGLIGDLCLDLYWVADMRRSELSRETPHFPLPIVEERYQPGGAGNVAGNLRALNPKKLVVLGITGEDWQSGLLFQALERMGIDTRFIVRSPAWHTDTYIKPLRSGISDVVYEDPRIDFENYGPLPQDAERALLDRLEGIEREIDVLCVCDQKNYGCITPAIREKIVALGEKGLKILVDSRDHINEYRGAIVKPNEVEAARAMGKSLLASELDDLQIVAGIAAELSEKTGRPAIVTVGDRGCLLCEDGRILHCPARAVQPPLDICGAGDTFLSALAAVVAGGVPIVDAVRIANLASSTTVKKIGMTGTATRDEIRAAWASTI